MKKKRESSGRQREDTIDVAAIRAGQPVRRTTLLSLAFLPNGAAITGTGLTGNMVQNGSQ
jgi:hypothetical protein